MDQPPKFTRHVWSQLWRLSKPFFFGNTWGRAWIQLGGLIVLLLAGTGVGVLANNKNGEIFNALEKFNPGGYSTALKYYLATFLLSIPLAAFSRYVEERLALSWRDYLARTLMKRFFHNRAYYRLGSSEEIDNPDQRISEDSRNFTTTTLRYLIITINSVIQVVAFSSVLWSISHLLVWVLAGYAVFGTIGAFLIGRPLIGLRYLQYEREADFRYGLVRVRDNAESIAFYRGERRELRDLRARLGGVVGNMRVVILRNLNLGFFTNGYNWLSLLLPVLIVAPLYLHHDLRADGHMAELGDITRAAGAFATVLAAVSLIVTQFEVLSDFAAGITRLGGLWDYLDEQDAEDDLDQEGENIEISEEARTIVLDDLTVKTPDGSRVLLKDLNFKLRPGGSLLIMGESGSGKSSLLRTIAGLWNCGEGHIGRPPYRNMMFLPQRPYMILGTLRAQLEYPSSAQLPDDEKLKEVLKIVNLPNLLKRVDGDFNKSADWANMLSLGEQQRVSFARLLLKKPAIAFLDESTSALDEPNEERLYQHLRKHRYTFVSVGHRSTLLKHHEWLLRIGKNATWELLKVADMESAPKSPPPHSDAA